MVKHFLYSSLAALAFSFAVDATAQTAYVGLASTPSSSSNLGNEGRIVSFDVNNLAELTGEYCKMPTYTDGLYISADYYIKAGASVGDKYYAYVVSDGDDEASSFFGTLNFETNEIGKITEGPIATKVSDMTYDATTETMYAVNPGSDGTEVYTVNLSDGSLKQAFTLDGVSVVAIAADGKGTLYGVINNEVDGGLFNVSVDLSLCTIDPASGTFNETRDISSESGLLSGVMASTMDYYDGKLYLIYSTGSSKIVAFDPASEAEIPEAVKCPVTSRLGGLTFIKSTEGGQVEEPTKPEDTGLRATCVEVYGDAMGISGDDVSKRTITYYDRYNNPVRSAQYGMFTALGGKSSWQIMYYTKYDYNDAHQLVSKHSEFIQMDSEAQGDFHYKSNNDTVNYEYDAEGRLAKETTLADGSYIAYEYDGAGQLVKKTTSKPDRFMNNGGEPLISTETYSDFVGFDKPQTIVGDGFWSSDKFWTVVEYDSENHKVKATKYDDAEKTAASEVERWTWRNDSIVQYDRAYVYDGEESPNNRIVYECVDGDPYRVREVAYMNVGGNWRPNGLPTVTYYTQMVPDYVVEGVTVTSVEEGLNTAVVSFDAPLFAVADGVVSFDIYREGNLIGTVGMDEATYDEASGKAVISFTDNEVPNGTYDYWVQTVVKTESTGDSVAYNVSDLTDHTYFIELPAVEGLKAEYVDRSDGYDKVHFTWQAPEARNEALRFRYDNIYVVGRGQANAGQSGIVPITDNMYDIYFADNVQDIYVESVYHFGRVCSDTISVDVSTLGTQSIDGVPAAAGNGKVTVDAGRIAIDGVASSVAIYTAAGALEASYNNVSSVDLAHLQAGVYVALVYVDGEVVAVKFSK